MLALLAGACSSPRTDAPPSESTTQRTQAIQSFAVSDFVVLAEQSFVVGQHTVVRGGALGARAVGSTPSLVAGFEAALDQHADVGTNAVLGDSLKLGQHATAGALFTNQFNDQGGTHGAVSAFLLPPSLPPASSISPGASAFTVAKKATQTLAASQQGAVQVEQQATLRLSGGLYQFASLTLKQKARVEVLAPSEVRVQGRLDAGQDTFVGVVAAGLSAEDARVEVNGSNGGNGGPTAGPEAASFGQSSEVRALVLVPSGTLRVHNHSQIKGAFFGRHVELKEHVNATFEDGFFGGAVCAGGCDDGNPCTVDSCDAGQCQHGPAATGTPCGDSNACNGAETCDGAGVCVGGPTPMVDDGNPCTADSCDPATGVAHVPVAAGTSCSDGNACNGLETCNGAGTCQPGAALIVDDNNACTIDSCDPVLGVIHTPAAAGAPCSDGNACNGLETCDAAGACQPGAAPTLDDGNPCTADSCHPATGVAHTPVAAGTPCSDGNACNGLETCDGTASCAAGQAPVVDDGNPCTVDSCDPIAGVLHAPAAAGASCSDGNACNGLETCNGAGACSAGTPPTVDDGNPCTVDSCNPATGVAHVPAAAGTSCSDGDACNGLETCNGAGACAAGTAPAVDDGNPCTTDSCHPATGVTHVAVAAGTSCSDGNACNGAEVCNNVGVCQNGSPPTLDDGNPCTTDACDPAAGVTHTPVALGTSCSDGNACNGLESCDAAGQCSGGPAPTVDDGNPCTVDSCDPATGVAHVPAAEGVSCSDGNACNGLETCNGAGTCTPGAAPTVDDGNPCTTDTCDPVTGVAHSPVAAGSSCSDSNACNGLETCNGAGACQPGSPLVVDDGNPCTVDSCDPVTGVAHTMVAAGMSCSDGNACNGLETCDAAGACLPGTPPALDDGNACTVDSCDPATGTVSHSPASAGTYCADSSVCNGAETCDGAGACQPGVALPNGTECAPGNACVGASTCFFGQCFQGPVASADDNNPCTVDACDPATGAVSHTPLPAGTSCSDGLLCNGNEVCDSQGACLAGTPLPAGASCSDGSVCNGAETCDGAGACQLGTPLPDGTECAPADACVGAASCFFGFCQPGPSVNVDDGNPCTTDYCDPVTGVAHSLLPDGTPCSDGNTCNGTELCDSQGVCQPGSLQPAGTPCPDVDLCNGDEVCDAAGSCTAGTPLPVDDGNACTYDYCLPWSGAQHYLWPAGVSCSDGNACNGDETCDGAGTCTPGAASAAGTSCSDGDLCNGDEACDGAGTCVAGTPPVTDDNNPCTYDTCIPWLGAYHSTWPAGTSCADGNACNGDEVCDPLGTCQPGLPLVLDDGNPCTVDACDPVLGATHTLVVAGTPCSDGNVCNGAETCDSAGQCVASLPPPDGTVCAPGNACVGDSLCLAGSCQPGSSLPIDDNNPCTADSCDPLTGAVSHALLPAGSSCSDSALCNGDEVCDAAGVCQPGSPSPAGTSCSDLDPCNGDELCDGVGTCSPGTPLPVDDGNACTFDACFSWSGVVHFPLFAGAPCGDSNACNGDETCDGAGTCLAGLPPLLDDANPCTTDSCDPATGVAHMPAATGTSCSDGDVCNGLETCLNVGFFAFCSSGSPLVVDDNNPCTADSCDPFVGVVHAPVAAGTSCSDGAACNGEEVCNAAGVCLPGSGPSLDDNNPCTTDLCDSFFGVIHVPLPYGSSCSDGNVCNGVEVCGFNGVCFPGTPVFSDDGNPCTADLCDPGTGAVSHTLLPAGASCSDNNACNGAETCDAAGSCLPGAPLPNGAECSPATACNSASTCSAGFCLPGASVPVDDGNECTVDFCDPDAGGVSHLPRPAGFWCSDGVFCNGLETCDGQGQCLPGTPEVESDGDPCTLDLCDLATGQTTHPPAPAGTPCADASICNGTETCDGQGSCAPGIPLVVRDAELCTLDACDPLLGVTHTPIADCVSPPLSGAALAPPLDPTVATNLAQSVAFLYTGSPRTQIGLDPATVDPVRLGVIRGLVKDGEGQALSNVLVSIRNHPELGETATRVDGSFDFAVNAGGRLTVTFEKPGYLTAQRQVQTTWQRFVQAPEVWLVPQDTVSTPISFGSSSFQVASGSPVTDADGTRQLSLFVPPGTGATMHFEGGASAPLATGTLRLTEYTVGPRGPQRMPADLPCTSAYTYAAELAFDEAVQAGAISVSFSQPVSSYVENFLGLTVGSVVPLGSYSLSSAAWKGEPDGRVVKVVGINAGVAELDTDGDGLAEPGATLDTQGISVEERQQLAQKYASGTELIRLSLAHFTPKDANVIAGNCSGQCSGPSGQPGPGGGNGSSSGSSGSPGGGSGGDDPNSCKENGSILFCENQSLGESIPVSGTPFRLVYNSSRTRARSEFRKIHIPLVGASVPSGLLEVKLAVDIAGQHYEASFVPSADLATDYEWNGLEGFERPAQGTTDAQVTVSYVYGQGVYEFLASRNGVSFPLTIAEGSSAPGTLRYDLSRDGRTATASRVSTLRIGGWIQPRQLLGGWWLNEHHAYDPVNRTLFLGDGTALPATFLGDKTTRMLGGGTAPIPPAGFDGSQLAANFLIPLPRDVAPTPDGGFLFSVPSLATSYPHGGVLRVDRDGRAHTWTRFTPSTLPQGFQFSGSASSFVMAPDESLLAADSQQIWRIRPGGQPEYVAGIRHSTTSPDCTGVEGDGGPATEACFSIIFDIAAGKDGSIYVLEPDVVRRIAPNGVVTRLAGQYNQSASTGDGGQAADAKLFASDSIATGPSGELYIAESGRIRRVACDGTITTIAGGSTLGSSGDEGPALNAQFHSGFPQIAVRPDGSMFIAEFGGFNCTNIASSIRSIDTNGIVHRISNSPICNTQITGTPLPDEQVGRSFLEPHRIVALADGRPLIYHFGVNAGTFDEWRALSPSLPSFSDGSLVFASHDGSEAYVFDRYGRHQQTWDTAQNIAKLTFGYDAEGRLASVTDRHGLVTSIERDPLGSPRALVAPYGQRTELALDANGYLASVTNPAAEQFQFSTSADGLILSLTDPRNGLHTFTYDGDGRLVRDDDADGGFKTLTRTASTGTSRTVVVETAMGRARTYQLANGGDGSQSRSVTDAAGLTTTMERGRDNSTLVIAPDGTETRTTMAADPRFGLSALYPTRIETKQPSGLTRIEQLQRQAVLSNPADPLSVTSWTEQRTVNGKTWVSSYDVATRTKTMVSPNGLTTTQLLSAQGDPLSLAVPGVVPWTFGYDAQGKLIQTEQTDGVTTRSTTMTYSPSGYLASVLDSLSQLTSFEHDAVGRVTKETRPDAQFTAMTYDASGNLASVTPPGKPTHTQAFTLSDQMASYTPPALPGTGATSYAYNPDHQLTGTTHPTGEVVSHGYDSAGRLASVTTAQGTYGYGYHPTTGKLASLSAPGGQNLAFLYDGSLLSQVTWTGPIAGSYQRSHDAFFRVASESVNGGGLVTFGYDDDGHMVAAGPLTRTFAPSTGFVQTATLGVVQDVWIYSTFGEVQSYTSSISGTPFYSVTYQRDNLGRISGKVESLQGVARTLAYSYDPAGRLTDVVENSVVREHYEYDANGNRLLGVIDGVSSAGAYDAQDRLLSYGSLLFTYNARGDLESQTDTTNGQVTTFQYDAFGNLRRADLPGGDVVEYVVDGQNRRVGRKVNGVLERGWLYRDQLQPVAELDAAGAVRQRFVRAGREHSPDVVVEGGVSYRVVKDQVGTVVGVVSSTGAVALTRKSRSFGEVEVQTGAMDLGVGFAGGLVDNGTGAVRFGARDYKPGVGRWSSKDSTRFESESTSLYVYSTNDSINRNDLSGNSSEPCDELSKKKPDPPDDEKKRCRDVKEMCIDRCSGSDLPDTDAFYKCMRRCMSDNDCPY
jgi:RHS repeat-associated protein